MGVIVALWVRARDESRKFRWGDFVPGNDPHGGEVLVWKAERGSKTRHGDGTHQRVVIIENSNSRVNSKSVEV